MGVECLGETNTCFEEGMEGKKKVVHRGSKAWIVATDSEYVVKGITEWLPTWKKNGFRTSKGMKPVNLDLFVALAETIAKYEAKGIAIGLWRIPWADNFVADELAKQGAADEPLAIVGSSFAAMHLG